MPYVRIKACCIQTKAELAAAIALNVDMVGFVSEMPAAGAIPDERIRRLAGMTPPGVDSVLLSRADTADEIVSHYRRTLTTTIQLVHPVPLEQLALTKEQLPHVKLMQVVYITGSDAIEEAKAVANHVDVVHLDTPSAHPSRPQLGGTGITHDWNISRRIRAAVEVPVMIAGGLTPKNVQAAVESVKPFGVDVCTGVRDDRHRLIPSLLQAFVESSISSPTQSPKSLRPELRGRPFQNLGSAGTHR